MGLKDLARTLDKRHREYDVLADMTSYALLAYGCYGTGNVVFIVYTDGVKRGMYSA